MPIELKSNTFVPNVKTHGNSKLVAVDTREKPGTGGYPLGYNGYVLLTVDNETLEMAYHDVHSKILSEKWVADIGTGTIKGTITPPPHSVLLIPEKGKTWHDAVK
jgi:hypothetical protein